MKKVNYFLFFLYLYFNRNFKSFLKQNIMKYFKFLFLLFFVVAIFSFSCENTTTNNEEENISKQIESEIILETETAKISGTLVLPTTVEPCPVVLIIAGSGPTDRDGNSKLGITAKPYKMISDTLVKYGIATVRFDKRGLAKSYYSGFAEKDLRFDDYVNDAVLWIEKLKNDKRFSKVIVLGHSEGSLIGIIACNKSEADAYISVAGVAQSSDSLLMKQLVSPPYITQVEVDKIFEKLRNNEIATILNPHLKSIFRLSVQPYISSWIAHSPKKEIAKLTIPVLIINGTTDFQVETSEAESLSKANPNAELVIIDGMNHILKDAPQDRAKNTATYANSKLPLNSTFCEKIVQFITK